MCFQRGWWSAAPSSRSPAYVEQAPDEPAQYPGDDRAAPADAAQHPATAAAGAAQAAAATAAAATAQGKQRERRQLKVNTETGSSSRKAAGLDDSSVRQQQRLLHEVTVETTELGS